MVPLESVFDFVALINKNEFLKVEVFIVDGISREVLVNLVCFDFFILLL